MERLFRYFTDGVEDCKFAKSIGMEIETPFVDREGYPITVSQSQQLLRRFSERRGWRIHKQKGELVTEIIDHQGNKILYELGRQNIELATAPYSVSRIVSAARGILEELYQTGEDISTLPFFVPILKTDEDLLVIPDERDAIWLELDGRPALELLARTSAVQFTVAVSPREAIRYLNLLGKYIGFFLKKYPQEALWRQYIKESKASYHSLRYGGPLFFRNLKDYCARLIEHDVVVGPKLVPYGGVAELDIQMFLRSIWWYFRLKRYGSTLCLEVRPLPRTSDEKLQGQLDFVLDILL